MADKERREEERQDRILAYLLHKMPEEEQRLFEQEMRQDECLASEVAFMKEIALAYRDKEEATWNEAVSDEVLMLVEDAAYTYQQKKKPVAARQKWHTAAKWSMRMLLFVFIAGGAFFYWGTRPYYTTEQLFADYYEIPEYRGYASRGDTHLSEETLQRLDEASACYEVGNHSRALLIYKEAMQGVEPLEVPNEDLFHYSMCLINAEQYDEAIEHLTTVTNKGQLLHATSEWYLALIYLKKGEKEQALSLLNKIVEEDTKYADRAKELIERAKRKKWF